MSDPSTLLLLTCVTCTDFPDSLPQADSVCTQSQEQNQSSEASAASPCVSPPESIRSLDSSPDSSPDALAVQFTVVKAAEEDTAYTEVTPRPAPPERFTQLPAAVDRLENRSESRFDPASAPLLRFGNQSKIVSQLQERLRQLGYYKGALDGVYGDLTVEAVSDFQRAEGLNVDGVVGRSTWAKLQQSSLSSAVEKKPQPSPPSTAPTQKREAPPSPSASPEPPIRIPQPNPSLEQRPAEQPSPAPSSPAQPSPDQSSPRLAEPPAMPEDPADLGRAYFWVSGWAIVYIGGFIFIYRNSHRRRVIGSQLLNPGKPLEAVQPHPAQPVELPKKAIQSPHPAQPVETSRKAESMVSGNVPPFISHATSYSSAQSSKIGATRQPPFYQTRKLNSPPQSYVAGVEDFGRGVTSTTAKSSTNTRVSQKTSPSTAKSTEHELVAIVADGGVAEPLRNLLLNLPGTSSADVSKQKQEKVNPFTKAGNQKKSDPSSSASKETPSAENADKLGALVAMLPPKDPETGTLYTYSLVSNAEGRFRLRGNELRIDDETLFESQDTISHTIVVGRLDGRGTYAEKSFVLNFTKSQAHNRHVSKRPA